MSALNVACFTLSGLLTKDSRDVTLWLESESFLIKIETAYDKLILNVWTLMDNTKADMTERWIALEARELQICNINIAALSETNLPIEGQPPEVGGGYMFLIAATALKNATR